MSRTVPRWAVALVLCALWPAANMAAPPAPAEGADQWLAERDRLKAESERLQGQGKTAEAIAALQKALALEKTHRTADHDDVLASLKRLGEWHVERDDLSAALAAWREEARQASDRWGQDHWRARDAVWRLDYAERLAKAGAVDRTKLREEKARVAELQRAGKLGDARAAVKATEEIQELEGRLIGMAHPLHAATLAQRATLLNQMGDHLGAADSWRHALSILCAALGDRHPESIRASKNLVLVLVRLSGQYEARENFRAAKAIREEVLQLYEKRYGKKAWQATEARLVLAHLGLLERMSDAERTQLYKGVQDSQRAGQLHLNGQYREALVLYQRALEACRTCLGERHPYYIQTINNMALVYQRLGDTAQAVQLLLRARDLKKEVLGEKHPSYATGVNNLATLYYTLGDNRQALKLHLQVRDLRKEILGEKHPDYATTLNDLALVYSALGDNKQALELLLQVRDLRKEILGEKHLHYADTLDNLAAVYRELGEHTQALELYLQVRDLRKELGQEKHPTYAQTLNDLAEVYYARKEYAAAAANFHEALALRQRLLGSTHADTQASLTNLTTSLVSLAKQAEGKEDFRSAAQAWTELVVLQEDRHGQSDWRAVNARLALANVRALEKMSTRQRQQLAQAGQENRQAIQMYSKGQYQEALPLVLRVLAARKVILGEKHPDYATTLNDLGCMYLALGNKDQALKMFLQARDLHQQILGEQHPDYATTLYNLASVYHNLGDNKQALKLLLQVRHLRKQILGEKHPHYADALHDLGEVYRALGDNTQALQLLLQVSSLRVELGQQKHPAYATTLSNLALVYRGLGDNHQALQLHLRVRDLRREILGEKHPDYATTLNNLAGVYSALGDNRQALQVHLQVRDLRQMLGREKYPDYASTLNNLASVYHALGDNKQALQLLLQVRDLCKEILGEKHLDYATTLNNLAAVYSALGDNKQALQLHLQVRDLRKAIVGEKHPDYAITLSNLALVYSAMQDNVQALKILLQVRDLQKEILGEKHPDYAITLTNLAGVYRALGNVKESFRLLVQVHDLQKEILGEKHPHCTRTLNNLAVVYREQGDYVESLTILLQVHRLQKDFWGDKHPEYALSLSNLALLYHDLGENAQALKLFLQVRDLRKEILGEKHPDYADTLTNLAGVYCDLRDYPQAAALSRQAIDLTRDTLERSSAALSERQQLEYALALRERLNNYLVCASDAGVPASEAYAPVLAWRGAVTARQRLTRSARTTADSRTARLFSQLEDVSRQLGALYGRAPDKPAEANLAARIEGQIARRERLEADLAEETAAFRQVRASRLLSLAQLQELLPAGVALIDFVEHGSDNQVRGNTTVLTAFVVRREGIRRVELGKTRLVAEAVRAFRGTLRRGRPVMGEDDPGVTLRRLVWEPLEEDLKGFQVVLLSPDGPLNDLPFAALPGKDPGKYLLEEVALAIVPVPQMLPDLLQGRDPARAGASPGLLLLGDIDYDAAPGASPAAAPEVLAAVGPRTRAERAGQWHHWERLAGMREEADLISTLFGQVRPRGRKTELRRGRATEAAVRQQAPKYEYLHFATHGFFAPREVPRATVRDAGRGLVGSGLDQVVGFHPGLLSGLVLAGANRPADEGDDGVLTALEVSELDLSKVELAVLSACETGLGEVAGGEGVVGLQRAFQVAGARSAVTSLWKVDDAATRALMSRFYENLWKHDKGPLEALREAQLWMLRGQSPAEPGKAVGDRGVGGRTEEGQTRTAPYYWAAFVLSGDWR